MAKLWQFLEGHPKPAFSEKKQTGDQEKLLKNRPKSTPRFKEPRALAKMSLSCNLHPLVLQRLEKILGQKSGSKSSRMAKLWQFLQGHPKPAFCEKVQKGDQGKFLKNRPKRCPRLKGPKSTLAQMALSSNLYALKEQILEKI